MIVLIVSSNKYWHCLSSILNWWCLIYSSGYDNSYNKKKTRGLQLCPIFHFTTQWFSNPRNCQNMILLWTKDGPHIVLQMGSPCILTNVLRDAPCQISLCWLNPVAPFLRNGKNMAFLWSKHCPSNWCILNLGQCAKGCSMPNFTLLRISYSPFPRNMPVYSYFLI